MALTDGVLGMQAQLVNIKRERPVYLGTGRGGEPKISVRFFSKE
ncbi:hypothetical protein [Marinomonas vulgaris]|nr:hypothetical protein [Marinomonas vulgaris]